MNTRFLVSVIIPTTLSRSSFHPNAHNNFTSQDYPNKELIWDVSEGTIGAKRNRLCEKAKGDIIVHMDDDDLYAPDWISRSVTALVENRAAITGLRQLYFYDIQSGEYYLYTYNERGIPWVAGATLTYWKSFWDTNRFKDIQATEDWHFTCATKNIFAHRYLDGFLASIHSDNTSPRNLNSSQYKKFIASPEIKELHSRILHPPNGGYSL